MIKARALVFFINSQDWYLDPLPPHFVHELYVLIQSYARESIVYFTPQSIEASERLNASDRFLCAIKQYGFHVCMCAVFDVQSRDRDSPAYNESDFFFLSSLCEPSQLSQSVRYAPTVQMRKIKTQSV